VSEQATNPGAHPEQSEGWETAKLRPFIIPTAAIARTAIGEVEKSGLSASSTMRLEADHP
jgi:hypothetical protein